MRLTLEDIMTSTALWADNVCLEQIEGDPLRVLTIKELDDLQQSIGELRMKAKAILEVVKYGRQS